MSNDNNENKPEGVLGWLSGLSKKKSGVSFSLQNKRVKSGPVSDWYGAKVFQLMASTLKSAEMKNVADQISRMVSDSANNTSSFSESDLKAREEGFRYMLKCYERTQKMMNDLGESPRLMQLNIACKMFIHMRDAKIRKWGSSLMTIDSYMQEFIKQTGDKKLQEKSERLKRRILDSRGMFTVVIGNNEKNANSEKSVTPGKSHLRLVS